MAGAGFCLLAGFLIGVVAGPETPAAANGVVASYESSTRELCLEGDDAAEVSGADDGLLCGIWNRGAGSRAPRVGDTFAFLTLETDRDPAADERGRVLIYGDVVD